MLSHKVILLCLTLPLNLLAGLTFSIPPDSPPHYYVATNGTSTGTGRKADPLDELSVMYTNLVFKTNGATFWFRSGTYTGESQISLVATGIVLRAYPGESPILQHGLYFRPSHESNTVHGLNLVSPQSERSLTWETNLQAGLECQAGGLRTIGNNVIGHTLGGIESWSTASNAFHYGDVFVGNGYELTTNNSKHGHSLYCQNFHGQKTISLCHFLYSASTSVDLRGTSAAYVNNVTFASNFVAGADSIGLIVQQYPYEFIASRGDYTSGDATTNIFVTDNVIAHDGSDGSSSAFNLGTSSGWLCGTNYNFKFERNLVKSGFAAMGDYIGFTFWTNVVWSDGQYWAGRIGVRSPVLTYPAGAIEGNSWFYPSEDGRPWTIETNNVTSEVHVETLEEWQAMTQGDTYGTLSTNEPEEVIVRVWPNALRDDYDPWWGDVAIWNPNRISNNVPVALSDLPTGTGIDVRYTGNILGGTVLTTTYNGSSITIPMTNLPTYIPNDPDWPQLPQPTNGASFRIYLTDSGTPSVLRVGTLLSAPK